MPSDPKARLRLTLFGGFAARFDGEPFELNVPRRVLAILAYIVLRGRASLRRDAIAEAIWPDDVTADARTKLRKYVHLLQHRLPPATKGDWLESLGATSLQWSAANPISTDVADFVAAHAAGDGAAATTLYAGALLPELDDPWLLADRERLRNLHASGLARLITTIDDPGQARTMLETVRRLLDDDPWHEDLLRAAMEMSVRSGNRGDAVAFYLEYEQRLREQYDAAPDAESYDLFRALAAASRPRRLLEPAAQDELPFVGRGRELDALLAAAREAERCAGSIAICSGEAGIGKSRLIGEFVRAPELRNATVLVGRTSPVEAQPYEAFAMALTATVPALEEMSLGPAVRRTLGHLLPELRLSESPAQPASDEKRLLHDALYLVFGELSRLGVVILVLEDLHWAGEGTWEALEDLAKRVNHLRLLIVVTMRDEGTADARARIEQALALPLGGLTLADVDRLIGSIGTANADARKFRELSTGNPLHLAELLRSGAAPVTLRAAIEARLQRLTPAQRDVAAAAAVAGARFDVGLVAEIARASKDAVAAEMEALIAARVLRRVLGTSSYEFVHDEVRRLAYEAIGPRSISRLHESAAQALERRGADDATAVSALVATHYEVAGDDEAAARWGARAARHAFDLHAYEESFSATERALGLARTDDTRWELHLLAEDVASRSKDSERRLASLAELSRLAEQRGPEASAEVALREVKARNASGHREEEHAAIERFSALVERLDDDAWRAQVELCRGWFYLRVGPFEAAERCFERALELFSPQIPAFERLEALGALSEAQMMSGRHREAEATMARARDVAERTGDQAAMLQVLRRGSLSTFVRRDFAASHHLSLEAHAVATVLGDLAGIADSLLRLGAIETRRLNFSLAIDYYRRARDVSERLGRRAWVAATLCNESIALMAFGDLDGAAANLRDARTLMEQLGETRNFFFLTTTESDLAVKRGDFEVACAYAAEGVAHARALGSATYESLGLLHLGPLQRETGDPQRSLETLQRGAELYRSSAMVADRAFFEAELGLTHFALGNLDEAAACVDRARELQSKGEGGSPGDSPYRVSYAEALVAEARGDRERASEAIGRALTEMATTLRKTREAKHRSAFAATPLSRRCIALAHTLGVAVDDDVLEASAATSLHA